MKEKDKVILSHLRNNAKESIVNLSKKIGVPASTIYDRVNVHEKNIIKRYTALLNFEKLGFHGRAYFAVKLDDMQKRRELLDFLVNHPNINSLYKINFGYHYLFEAIFKNVVEAETFINTLNEKFELDQKHIFSVVEDIKKEDFLTKPEHYDALI